MGAGSYGNRTDQWYLILDYDSYELQRFIRGSVRDTDDVCVYFLFDCSGDHRDLHSFPTRRSSDLYAVVSCARMLSLDASRSIASICARGVITSSIVIASRSKRLTRMLWCFFGMNCPDSSTSRRDRKSTRLNSSHGYISYAVFCLKK